MAIEQQLTVWQRLRRFYEKRPLSRGILIGSLVGFALVGGFFLLATTGVITVPALLVTIALYTVSAFAGILLGNAVNLLKHFFCDPAPESIDSIELDTIPNSHASVIAATTTPEDRKASQSKIAKELAQTILAVEQLKKKEQQKEMEKARQKELAEAQAKAAEEERKKQIAKAADKKAKGLATEIVEILDKQNQYCKNLYREHHLDAGEFYKHFKQEEVSLMGFLNSYCKSHISADDYTALTNKFAEFKKQFNVEELQRTLIENSMTQDEAVRKTIAHEDEMLEDLNQKSGFMMAFRTDQSSTYGHQ